MLRAEAIPGSSHHHRPPPAPRSNHLFPATATPGLSPACTRFPSLELPARVLPSARPTRTGLAWKKPFFFVVFVCKLGFCQLLVKSVRSQLCYTGNPASRIASVAETDSDQGTTPTPLLKTKEVRPTPRDRRESYNVITRLHGIFMAKRTLSSFERSGFSLVLFYSNTSTQDPRGKNQG